MSRVSSLPHQSGNVGKRLPEGHEEDFCCYNYYLLLLCPISINFEECFYFGPLCFLAPVFFFPAPGFFFPAPGFFFPALGGKNSAPGKKNPAPESTMDQNRKTILKIHRNW